MAIWVRVARTQRTERLAQALAQHEANLNAPRDDEVEEVAE